MAVKHLFSTEYVSQAGVKYKLDIHDMYAISSVGTPTSFDVDNIELDYQSSDLMPALIGSSLRLTARMNHVQRNAFFNAVKAGQDTPLSCGFYEYRGAEFELVWCGIIVPEECSEVISDEPIEVAMVFSDGINSLSVADYSNNGEPYTDKVSLTRQLYRVLKNLLHIEIYSSPNTVLFREIGTPTPSGQSEAPWNPVDSVFDNTFIPSSTFNIPKLETQRDRAQVTDIRQFRSCYEVLEDICVAMGLSCCMAEGRITFFSRSYLAFIENKSQIRYRDFGGDQESDFDIALDKGFYDAPIEINEFLLGASKSFIYPIKGYMITHEEYGSDIIGSALSYRMPGVGGEMSRALYDLLYDPLYDTTSVMPDGSEQVDIQGILNRGTSRDMVVNDISITGNGENTIRIEHAMNVSMRHRGFYNVNPVYTVGNIIVCRMIIELVDDTGTVYRLRRRVITLDQYSTGQAFSININAPFPAVVDYNYLPKTYETFGGTTIYNGEFGFDWVPDTDARFSQSYFESIINDPQYLQEESPSKGGIFLQNEFLNSYFPIPTGCEPDDTGLELIPKKGEEYNKFYWKLDHTIEVPDSGTQFVEFRANSRRIVVYSAAQKPLADSEDFQNYLIDGNYISVLDGDYVSNEVGLISSEPYKPSVSMGGFVVRIGEGDGEENKVTIAYNSIGKEIIDGGSSRISGRSYTTDNTRRGLLWAKVRGTDGLLTGPTLDTRWAPEYDTEDYNPDLHHMVCSEAAKMRSKAREFLSATAIKTSIIHPYRLFSTDSLSSGTETYLPFATKFDLLRGQCAVDAMLIGFERGAILEVDDIKDVKGNGSSNGGGPSEPGWGEVIDGKVLVQGQKVDLISITEAVDLDVIKTKTDFITVTEPVNLNDISAPDLGKLELFSIFIGKK
jgi:hypothetical protein